MEQRLYEALQRNPIIAAVRDDEGLAQCLRTDIQTVFVLYGDICNISEIVRQIKDAGKIAIVHVDLIQGLSSKEVAVDFIHQNTRADGIISTKAPLVRHAMDLGMIGGQVMDMENEQRSDVQVEDLQVMCAAKTGALIRAACKMGCIAAGASEETIQQADHYGACLGLAFQIVDDILDVTSTTEVLGKPVGSDAAEHKQTFVTLLGIDAAREEANRLTQEAIEALQPFPEHAVLLDLTKELLERKK